MDHLPTPHRLNLIELPYLSTGKYDGGDFLTYPQRKHLDEERMRIGGKFDGHTQEEIEAFLQSWLYFGALTEVFRVARVDLNLDDFVRVNDAGKQVLSTAKLPELLKKWGEKEVGIVLGDPDQESRKARIFLVLRTVLDWIGRYGSTESRMSALLGDFQPDFWPLSPETSLALIALGSALGQAFHLIYRSNAELLGSWRNSELLRDRLLGSGFCPNQVQMIQTRVAVDCQYYYSCMWRPERRHTGCSSKKCLAKPRDHSNCDVSNCLADYTDEKNYRTLHVDCGCPCVFAEENDQVNEIVLTYGVPIITWSEEKHGDGFKLRVTRYEPGMHYVAISHVWADGLGNTKRNALPKCQLYRLQSYVDTLYRTNSAISSERKSSSSPKESRPSIAGSTANSQAKPEQPADPERQLAEMLNIWQQVSSASRDALTNLQESIYHPKPKEKLASIERGSTKFGSSSLQVSKESPNQKPVYGFWIDTLCVPVLPEHKWLRKLAIKKMADVYRRADAVLVLDSGIQRTPCFASLNEQAAEIFLSSWMRRLWTLQEGSLCPKLYFQFSDDAVEADSLQGKILKKDRPGSEEDPQRQKDSRLKLHEMVALQSLSMVLADRDNASNRGSPIPEGFRHITDAMSWRTTSRTTDENICLAVLMNLHHKLPEKQQERFSRADVLREVFYFPSEIIFRGGERMPERGFGWAPSSFLRPRDSKTREWDDKWRSPATLSNEGGLVVTYSGFRLFASGVAPRSSFKIVVRGVPQSMWYIQVIDQDDKPAVPIAIGEEHAIVLSTKLENHAPMRRVICALVELTSKKSSLSKSETTRWIQTKYLCRAWVSLMSEKDRKKTTETQCRSIKDRNAVQCKRQDCVKDHPVWGIVVGEDQEWCIG